MTAVIREEWHALPTKPDGYRRHNCQTEIRQWAPGDGLTCRSASINKKFPCTRPVVVVRETWEEMTGDFPFARAVSKKARNTIACSRHVAEFVRSISGEQAGKNYPTSITTEAEKAAREFVLAKYWDEYQAALEGEVVARRDAALECLPASLREYFTDEETAS